MKDSIQKELKNFYLLDSIRERVLLKKSAESKPGDFDFYYKAYNSRKLRLLYLSASMAAAILLLVGISVYRYQNNLKIKEQEYFTKQSELIAITDEALLTAEYLRYLEDYHFSTIEEEVLWLQE